MQDRSPRPTHRNPFVFLNVIGVGILVVTVLASAGVFGLKTYTEQSIAAKKTSLDRQRAAFEPATIEELLRLDKRLTASQGLLKSHVAVTLLFDDLESRTGENVRFKSFKYEPAGQDRFAITMNGVAKSFNAVAIQSDSFGKSSVVKDPIFSNLNLDPTGDVIFDFGAIIDPVRINFATLIAGAAAAGGLGEPTGTDEPQEPTAP
jgi:hypothetical protein